MKKIYLGNNRYTLVDDADFDLLNKFKWRFMGRYVVRHQRRWEYENLADRKIIAMHTQIMNTPNGWFIDHINHQPLDNRRSNLRIVTSAQNNQNKKKSKIKTYYSKYKGVSFYKKSKKWVASIKHLGNNIYLGSYDDEKLAARAYRRKAVSLFKEFACI